MTLALVAAIIWHMSRPSGSLSEFDDLIVDHGRELVRGEVRVTFLGTAMFLVDDGSTQLLFDAYLSPVPFPELFGRSETDEAFVDDVLDRVAAHRVTDIFISHSHHDHALDAGYLATTTGAILRGTASTLRIGRGDGVPKRQRAAMRPGDAVERGEFAVTAIESRHSPCRIPGHCTTITAPLDQPRNWHAYKEGGSLDFLVEYRDLTMLFKASANYVPGALDRVEADALFIGTATLSGQTAGFRDAFAAEVLDAVRPSVVVPTHWNDLLSPLDDRLPLNRNIVDDAPASLHELKDRSDAIGADFVILDGYDRVILSCRRGGGNAVPYPHRACRSSENDSADRDPG